jgi:hypothetical protein
VIILHFERLEISIMQRILNYKRSTFKRRIQFRINWGPFIIQYKKNHMGELVLQK